FRADLHARLAGFTLTLSPLRERREDIGAIVRTLLVRHASAQADSIELSAAAIRALFAHPWPGNIRELEKAINSAVILGGGKKIDIEHLPEPMQNVRPGASGPSTSFAADTDSRERLVLLLTRHHGNVSAVAAELRTSRMQVHRLCRRYAL